jgi:hypothetical protein
VSIEGDPIFDSITLGSSSLITDDFEDKDSTSPSFKVDDNSNFHLAWVDNGNILGSGNDFDVYYRYKPELNPTWTEVILISDATQNSNSKQPTLTVDSQNQTWVAWIDDANYLGSGNDDDVFIKNCTGGTWNGISVISNHPNDGVSSEPFLEVDDLDNIHMVWVDDGDIDGSGTDTDIIYRKFNSTTHAWETPFVISNQNNAGESRNPSLLAVNEYIHVVWEDNSNYSGNGDDFDILYRYWDPIPKTWSSTFTLSTDSSDGESINASLGAGPDKNADVYVIWEDNGDITSSGTDFDILYRKYDPQTSTWSSITLISNQTNDGDSLNPKIIPGLYDNLHMIWSDNGDISNSGTDFDIMHERLDGTFNVYTPPQILTTDVNDGDSVTPVIDSVIEINQNLETFYLVWVDDGNIGTSGVDTDIFYQIYQINYSYPSKLKIDVGNKGSWDWYYSGTLDTEMIIGDNVTSSWFSRELNSVIENTTTNDDEIVIPINIYSSTQGLLRIFDLNLTYTIVPSPPDNLKILHQLDDMHLLNHTPILSWTFNDEDSFVQGWYELEVGSTPGGNDMWDPSPAESSATNLTYNGLELMDGETYYFRVRTRDRDGSRWSGWSENKSFRFNTPPEITWLKPVKNTFTTQVNITWNTTDAENDNRYVTLQVFYDDNWHGLVSSTRAEKYIWDISPLLSQTADIRIRCWDGFEYSSDGWFNPDGEITIHRNTPPIITIISPPGDGVSVNKQVTLQWKITDPDIDDVHSVDLYYDTDTDYQDKNLIKNDLTSTSEYVWDTSTIEDGDYYICAEAHDGTESSFTYSEGIVTIDHTVPTIPPKISMIYPPFNSDDIPIDVHIWVRFNVPIDANTVTGKTFKVFDSSNHEISGEISYSGEKYEAMFIPDNNLTYSEVYTVHITTGIKDLEGNTLDGNKNDKSESSAIDDFTWFFKTTGKIGDIHPPRIIDSFPLNNATNVENSTFIIISFSEDMDVDTLMKNVFLYEASGNFVPATLLYDRETFQLMILPDSKLLDDTIYVVIIASGAKDIAGRSLDGNNNNISEGSPYDDFRLTFTTGSTITPQETNNETDDPEDDSEDLSLLIALVIIIILVLIGIAFFVFRKVRHGDFKITNIFIIYNDGRLLTRYHRKSDKTVDDSAVSSMLTAIQDFIHDSFKESADKKGEKSDSGSGESFDELRYGKLRIYIEYDKNFYIAVMGEGKEIPVKLRKQLITLKKNINNRYHKVLEYWDGNMSHVKGMRDMLEPLMKK